MSEGDCPSGNCPFPEIMEFNWSRLQAENNEGERDGDVCQKCQPSEVAADYPPVWSVTEVLWAGSRHGSALLGSAGPSLQLGNQVIAATDHVRVLGVTLSSDLSLSKHVSNTCTACFY